jgi:N-acetylglucosaminyl-diphospho-decaprenol L-rhamnosyltransferase
VTASRARGGGRATPPFTAVVVTHDSERELGELLDSIERHLDPRPQVIVVDADSADGSLRAAEGRAETVALGANPGFGAASNAGVERAESDVTALLNPDVVLLDGGLAKLAERARGRDVLIAPRLLNADGSVQRSAHPQPGRPEGLLQALVHPRALPRALRLRADPWRSDERREVGWAVAACLVGRTSLLRRLGPFDPSRFLFYEDMDLCLRARAAGVPTELHPDVALRHTGAHSTAPSFGGEPYELLARRRRETIASRLGWRALALDDLSEALTFATRAGGRALLRRDSSVQRARLAALRRARRGPG